MSERAGPEEGLEVRMSVPGQLRVVVLIGLIGVAYPVGWAVGLVDAWLAVVGVVFFGGVATYGLRTALRSRTWPPVVVLGPEGVDVLGHGTVPWWQVSHLVVSGLQPSWFFVVGRRRYPVVAFIPHDGSHLPWPRVPGELRRTPRLVAARERRYGTQLLLLPHAMTATAEEVAAAALCWGGKETQFRW